MSDDLFETPTAGTAAGLADGDGDHLSPRLCASDGLLAEIGLSVRAIRELRGFPPGAGADR